LSTQTLTSPLQPIDLLSPGGNLDAYIRTVNAVPMLTPEREASLAKRLFEDGDLDAARQLVFAHLRFVVYVSRSYGGYGLAEADLIQEGNVGLMKAVKRFNPEFKVRLVSFAVHWIKAEMHEYILKNWRIVKIATTKAQRKLFFNLRSTRRSLGWMSENEVTDVAQALGVEPRVVRQMEGRMAGRDLAFDRPDDDDENGASPVDFLADVSHDPGHLAEAQDDRDHDSELLALAVEGLDGRTREIISSRWLTEPKSTLHDLADRFGISAERVRQIEANGLKKLRDSLSG
jgi:RNA polymerase sigma-32 factor